MIPFVPQHQPQNTHERRFLHGAACHGCLLIAETSCEQQNDFLDRALVVRTVDNLGVEFFRHDKAMTGLLQKLSDSDLQEIALAIRSGRLALPYSTIALQRLVPASAAPSVASDLQWLSERGFAPEQLAVALDMLIADRRARPRLDNLLELVTTGPEVAGIANRDTSVVVRDLFTNARESVLLAGYAIYQGQRVFQALADRMLAVPALKVGLFLDIQRAAGDTSAPAELMMRLRRPIPVPAMA